MKMNKQSSAEATWTGMRVWFWIVVSFGLCWITMKRLYHMFKYSHMIRRSELIGAGPPSVYRLQPNRHCIRSVSKRTFGHKSPKKTVKTVLLVGETGTGKSSLIDALFNFNVGVESTDQLWFEIVENEARSQTDSQTSDVTLYEIFEGDLSLTVIDTPGFGDTRGPEKDQLLAGRLLELLSSDDGVRQIHAVGLVLKASENRLSDRTAYVFNSVTSLFGKNMERNIVALITHSDGMKPTNALRALEDAQIKCSRDKNNDPVYFLFNNRQNTTKRGKAQRALGNAWETSQNGLRQFTKFLKKSTAQSVETTVDVLKERLRLETCVRMSQNPGRFCSCVGWRSEELRAVEQLREEALALGLNREEWVSKAYEHILKLQDVALNVDSLSTYVHLDFLIEKTQGDAVKVQKLQEIKLRMDSRTRHGLLYLNMAENTL